MYVHIIFIGILKQHTYSCVHVCMHVRRTYLPTCIQQSATQAYTYLQARPLGYSLQANTSKVSGQLQVARYKRLETSTLHCRKCGLLHVSVIIFLCVQCMHKIHTHNYYQHLACTQHLLHIHSHACQGQDYWGMPRESLVHHEYNRPTPRRAVQVRQVDRFWD